MAAADHNFSFPALPKPKPLPSAVPTGVRNPLLAGATVTDRTAAQEGAAVAGRGGTAPLAPLDGPSQPTSAAAEFADASGGMGGSLGKPVVLSRHQRAVAPAAGAAAGASRKKVPFEKGYSQMDWVRLTQTHPDLAGLGGQRPRRDISMEEVAKHRSKEDCWTVLRGKVYNITQYLRFHPGGVPLLLAVGGRDGTALFNKYHAWVNYEFLLAKCLVGVLAPPNSGGGGGSARRGAAAAAADAELEQRAQQQQQEAEEQAAEGGSHRQLQAAAS